MDQKKAYGPHEAVTLGLELEIAGYNFYTRVAQAATDYRIRDLFQHLANSEKEHRRVIKEEIEPIFAPEWYREEDQEMMAQYLRKIEKQPVFPNPERRRPSFVARTAPSRLSTSASLPRNRLLNTFCSFGTPPGTGRGSRRLIVCGWRK